VWVASSVDRVKKPTAVALGNFDGVHRGHQQVIRPVVAWRQQNPQMGCHATVVTFSPHPQEFFTGEPRLLLTPAAEKARRLEKIGVDQLVLLPFNHALAALTPEGFVQTILIQKLQAQKISVGSDFRFGRRRVGTANDLRALTAVADIDVTIVPIQSDHGERISSSAIRQALQEGDLPRANFLLGYSYHLTGQVIQGQQLGRQLGFPTANLQLSIDKFLPRRGVYGVWVGGVQPECMIGGVMNLGCRPTIDGKNQTVEVHLLNWSGDLYGKTLTVHLERFLRPEEKFASLDELKHQIQIDCELTRQALSQTGANP